MAQIITIPPNLRTKLGDEAAQELVELLNQVNEKYKVDIITLVEEKFEKRLAEELAKLRVEFNEALQKVRGELKEDIANLRAELKGDIANLRAELKGDIANTRADIIKWMFIFWVTQFIALGGLIFTLLKF